MISAQEARLKSGFQYDKEVKILEGIEKEIELSISKKGLYCFFNLGPFYKSISFEYIRTILNNLGYGLEIIYYDRMVKSEYFEFSEVDTKEKCCKLKINW